MLSFTGQWLPCWCFSLMTVKYVSDSQEAANEPWSWRNVLPRILLPGEGRPSMAQLESTRDHKLKQSTEDASEPVAGVPLDVRLVPCHGDGFCRFPAALPPTSCCHLSPLLIAAHCGGRQDVC